jgi:hypothetical protein
LLKFPDDLLDVYRHSIAISVTAKDNNAFWPRGIPALSYPSSWILVGQLQNSGLWNPTSLNPTAALCLYLYATHGIRRARLPIDERVTLARKILEHVVRSRSGELVPAGSFNLSGWQSLAGSAAILSGARRTDFEYIRQCHLLGGELFALAEASYFFCHRLMTERHGPYRVNETLSVSCRHAVNLNPSRVWPELGSVPPLPSQLTIWTLYDTDLAGEFSYDLFANAIFCLDPFSSCRGLLAFAVEPDGAEVILSLRDVRNLRSTVVALTRKITEIVRRATELRLAEAMYDTMRQVAIRVLGHPERQLGGRIQLASPFDFRVTGSSEEIIAYYDWRNP